MLTAAGLAWLVATPSGQQMLAFARPFPSCPASSGSIEGGFFDLTITDLSYEMPGLTAGADRITLRSTGTRSSPSAASPLRSSRSCTRTAY